MNPLRFAERNIEAWNASDIEARLDTLHFPQSRIDVQGNVGTATREQTRRGLVRALDFVKEHEGWYHSEIAEMRVIHESSYKVHILFTFSRHRADGTHYASLKAIWVMARIDGEWKRVSVSNMPLEYHLPEEEVETLMEKWSGLTRSRS